MRKTTLMLIALCAMLLWVGAAQAKSNASAKQSRRGSCVSIVSRGSLAAMAPRTDGVSKRWTMTSLTASSL